VPERVVVWVPAGVEHGFRVGQAQSRKLNIYVPAAMEGYFESLAEAATTGTVISEDGFAELAARHGLRVTGPVPQGYL